MDLLAICMSSLKQSLQVLCPFVNQTGVFAGFCFRAGEGGWGGGLKAISGRFYRHWSSGQSPDIVCSFPKLSDHDQLLYTDPDLVGIFFFFFSFL